MPISLSSTALPFLTTSLHLDWLRSVLFGITPPPDLTIRPASGALLAVSYISTCLALGILSAMTLPERTNTTAWKCFRIICWLIVVKLSVDFSIDPAVSLGAPLRDMVMPLLGWNALARMTDLCVVSVWDGEERERAPRWIVPAGSKLLRGVQEEGEANGQATSASSKDKPMQWKVVPHSQYTLLSLRRLLWAVDHISLLRPGTSWFLPAEQRALEWSLSILTQPAKPHHHRFFGRSEGLPYLITSVVLSAAGAPIFMRIMSSIPQSSTGTGADNFYALKWWEQGFIPLWIGLNVPLQWTVMETLFLFPLVQRSQLLPSTALLPAFAHPLLASGPTDLWGRRWHPFVRRAAWRNASLFVPRSWGAWGSRLGSFVITGSLHGWAVIRWIRPLPPSTLHALVVLLLPGPMALFVGQGVACVLELLLLGPPPAGRGGEKGWRAWARSVWLWVSVAWMGRWLIATIVSLGMATKESHEGAWKWV